MQSPRTDLQASPIGSTIQTIPPKGKPPTDTPSQPRSPADDLCIDAHTGYRLWASLQCFLYQDEAASELNRLSGRQETAQWWLTVLSPAIDRLFAPPPR